MKNIEDEYRYEEKMDQLTDYLEEIILDAILAVLKNLKHKNNLFYSEIPLSKKDDIPFWSIILYRSISRSEQITPTFLPYGLNTEAFFFSLVSLS